MACFGDYIMDFSTVLQVPLIYRGCSRREGLAEEHGVHWRGRGWLESMESTGGGGLLKEHGVHWRGEELAEESTGGGGNECTCGLGRMCM